MTMTANTKSEMRRRFGATKRNPKQTCLRIANGEGALAPLFRIQSSSLIRNSEFGFRASRRPWPLLAALATILLAPAVAPAQAWWNYDWPYRRAVDVKEVVKKNLPGENAAVVTMPTCGLTAADGSDIVVANASGQVVPHRVLMTGPGDTVRVAFALQGAIGRYYVYFGNPKPPKPAELELKRGVLLEMWAYAGGAIGNLKELQALFAKPGKLIGRDFVPTVFLGHNPFGPQNQICSLFTGWLDATDDGEYVFSTSSQDASFLLVDGKLVVANGGLHPPQRRAVRTNKVALTRGLHELKVYHVNTTGDPVIMAAWQEPSAKRLWTIEPKSFAPIALGQPGMMEQYGKAADADFLPRHAGETFMAEVYYQRYAFEALVKGQGAAKPTIAWDFGDGQTAAGPKVEHVYLRNGPFKVTMTAKVGGETIARANRVYVTRPWDRVTESALDPVADHAGLVAGYDFTQADPADIAAAVALFQRAGMAKAVIRAGDALVKRDAAPPEVLQDAVPVYADALAAAGESARAVAACLKAAEMTKDPAAGAIVTVKGGRVALAAGEADRAGAIFEQAIKKYAAATTHEAIREARIGTGDVWRIKGDYKKAMEAYDVARPAGKEGDEKLAVRKGDLTRHVEDYTQRKMFADAAEYLELLEQEFPADKLEGFSSLLRVRLEMAQKRYAPAAEEAEVLVRVNPQSNYAPELLMLAAEAYAAGGKKDVAARTLQRVADNYPESPLAAQAKKKLQEGAGK